MDRYYRGLNNVVWRVRDGDLDTAVVWDFNDPQRWKCVKAPDDVLSGEEIPAKIIPQEMLAS